MKKKNTTQAKQKNKCDCPSCREYERYENIPTEQEIHDEELNFLRFVGVKVKKAKNFTEALKIAINA